MDYKDLHNEIAMVAYEIYEQSGYIQGYDLDHWFKAEKIVLSRYAPEPNKKIKVAKIPKQGPAKKAAKTTVKKTDTKKTQNPTKKKGIKK
ncbi:MAG: DUF2934 domain-containing protein [Deltaproteobacteria bacterium]|nr:DUF2934 domain-containing protein [Deltaproteobacteria bacterium]